MSKDVLYDCAEAYKKLMDYEFDILLKQDLQQVKIRFTPQEFMHLTSLEKLRDLSELRGISSQTLLKMVLDKELTYKRIQESIYFNEQKYSGDTQNIEYGIKDRLNALTNLYDYFDNINLSNVTIHKWLNNVNPDFRPHFSKINADFLFQFFDTFDKQTQSERVCAFFIENGYPNNVSNGVSIFPTDKAFDKDNNRTSMRYDILSVKSICLSTGAEKELISASHEQIQEIKTLIVKKDIMKTISNDIKSLKINRRKAIESPSEKTQSKYEKQLSIFKNRNIYSEDMLKEVINRLNAQLSDVKDEKSAEMIKSEIKVVQDELDERMRSPSQQIKDISISTTQANPDGTLSIKPIVSVPIPKAVTDIPKVVQRSTHTMTGSVKSFLSDIANKLNKHFAPKPPRTPSRASQSKSKDNSPKKAKSVKKERPVAPVKRSLQKQEQRPSVLAELKTIKAEQQVQDKPERSHQHRKTKSNDREI